MLKDLHLSSGEIRALDKVYIQVHAAAWWNTSGKLDGTLHSDHDDGWEVRSRLRH